MMNDMSNIIKDLEEKNIYFDLQYYGEEDYSSYWEIKTIIDYNDTFFKNIFKMELYDIKTLDDYVNFLFVKKISSMKKMLELIKNEENKKNIEIIINLCTEKSDNIDNRMIIQFINNQYKNIFVRQINYYSIIQPTIDYISKFQNGINIVVFEFLSRDYNYLLLEKFQSLEKTFNKYPQLFDKLFHYKSLEDIRSLRADCIFPIFECILKQDSSPLKLVVDPIVENIINDFEIRINRDNEPDILLLNHEFQKIYSFLKDIKHPKANTFTEYNRKIEERISIELKNNGRESVYEIPVVEILSQIKLCPDWREKMLSLTHECKNIDGVVKWTSRFDMKSSDKKNFIDQISSNLLCDNYFTHSHQRKLDINISIGAAITSGIWHDNELFNEYMNWHHLFLNFVKEQINCNEDLNEDLDILFTMLQPVILSDEKSNRLLSPLSYGAGMFICSLIEKLLRSVYIFLLKDTMYVPIKSATLGSLLSPDNKEIVEIFGENHLKNLLFFLCTSGQKKIGLNMRNSLAHWVDMKKSDLSSVLVAKLFYLYTDILNTIFWFFYENFINE